MDTKLSQQAITCAARKIMVVKGIDSHTGKAQRECYNRTYKDLIGVHGFALGFIPGTIPVGGVLEKPGTFQRASQ